jgi:N-acetylmuramoyl-L-alanine amidase
MFTIIIDPGHGGDDPGAVGEFSQEKDINLSVAKKLYDKLLQNPSFIPYMTRTDDRFVRLTDRAKFAIGKNFSLFMSIHCNASESSNPKDAQVYFFNKETSGKFSTLVFSALDKIDKATSKWSGVKFGNFQVLRMLASYLAPAILIELAFISNAEDELLLNDHGFQDDVVAGIYGAIKSFLNIE